MGKIKILIIEDESIVALDLKTKLEKLNYEVVAISDNADEAIKIVKNNKIDVALLDINIKGDKDGIELANDIRAHDDIMIIFTTAFSDNKTIQRAKEAKPNAYLLKPYRDIDLLMSIDLIFQKTIEKDQSIFSDEISCMKDRVFIKKANGRYEKLYFEEILYLKSERNYCDIYSKNQKYTLSLSINKALDIINSKTLVRVHRSYAVNVANIDSLDYMSIDVNEHNIPIGKMYKDDLFKIVKKIQ